MTYQNDFTLPSELLEQIASEGLDFIPTLIEILINAAMQAERSKHLRAIPYERTVQRNGYANGYKPKTVKTRLGELHFEVLLPEEDITGIYRVDVQFMRSVIAATEFTIITR
ncbi:MAG: hypothetical protein DRI56_13705 [Chloroflexota bacterium]|nr:MAG: hypothetical protein DRI56_13705 [Chloroflexota bacterium]